MARWIFGFVAVALVAVIIVMGVAFFKKVMSGDWGGGEIVLVPDVLGAGEELAATELQEKGLIANVSQRSYNNDYPQGQIYKQIPAAGKRTKTGRKVNLWLSLGPADFTVPDLIGMSYEDAGNLILESGLIVGKARRIYSTSVPAGEVVNQLPAAGDTLTMSVPIDITVADRQEVPVTVPAVVGSTLAAAEDLLARRNLRLAEVNYIASDAHNQGTILGQSLASGKSVPIGTTIAVDVAVDPGVKQALTKSFSLSIQVPPGPQQQQVKIKVFDNLGPQGVVEYDETHAPGYRIQKRINVEGSATVMVFIGNMEKPHRKDRI